MSDIGWNDNRVNDYVRRNAERSAAMWGETLRFMRDSYEARLGAMLDENERLREMIKEAQDAILFMSPLPSGGTAYDEQVDMRRRCYEAIASITKEE